MALVGLADEGELGFGGEEVRVGGVGSGAGEVGGEMGLVNDAVVVKNGVFAFGEALEGANLVEKLCGGVLFGAEWGIVRGEFAGECGLSVVLGNWGGEMIKVF